MKKLILILTVTCLSLGVFAHTHRLPKLPSKTHQGVPIFYVNQDDDILCPNCASKIKDRKSLQALINWNSNLLCVSCLKRIESLYSEPREGTYFSYIKK